MASGAHTPAQPQKQGDYWKLVANTKELLKSGEFSDLRLICPGRTWDVHKAIVCPQSTFVAEECRGNAIKVSDGDMVYLPNNTDPLTIDALLNYMYTSGWETPSEMVGTGRKADFSIRLFVSAGKLGIDDLRAQIMKKARTWLYEKDQAPDYCTDLIRAIYAYLPDSAPLRDAMLASVMDHVQELYRKPDKHKRFHDRMKAYLPVFMKDVYDAILARYDASIAESTLRKHKRYKCPKCAAAFVMDESVNGQAWCVNCGAKRSVDAWKNYLVKDAIEGV
ncbi:hypothetical protein BAUCODRAFT_35451 [Baudoinia panamericana UAMH 10762]|uniref:BTB domain-containing protein n=1 Tax=Baudoinia panamericana (strain UAMH 10762) TaxID=717646 RepID=M2N9I2_BAUPA|nr:uncharacterized protein BAUCODRAFT_35451 [Baudoinia panamericana UAMH 10762]EMC95470.1 hypothetical protein BAUCODRAFT_35451 [Baudoinia panamericana UAMH 10762]